MRHLLVPILLAAMAWPAPACAQQAAIQQLLDAVDPDSLVWRMERLTGEAPVDVGNGEEWILSRHKHQPGNALSAQWLQQELVRMGYAPVVQPFGALGGNVLAELTGAVHPARKVYLTAHYDCMPGVAVAPGADDNGSGVCAVLEAARVMAGQQFEHTVVFALWDEEEQGLIGSAYHASAAFGNDEEILAVVNLDAIGYDGNGDGLLRIHARPVANSLAIKDSALMVNATYGLDLPIAINNPGATYSDHASFWNNGYGAILIIEDFDNDPNPHYHTPADRLSELDLDYWHQLTRLAIGTTAAMAVPMNDAGVLEAPGQQPAFSLFPNPVHGHVQFRVQPPATAPCTLVLTDASGRELRRWTLGSASVAQHGSLDLGGLAAGSYLLGLVEAGRSTFQRLVVLP